MVSNVRRPLRTLRSSRLAVVPVAIALVAAACGGSTSNTEPAAETPATEAPTAAEPSAVVLETSASLVTTGAPLPQPADGAPDAAIGLAAPVITGQSFDGSDVSIGGPTDGPTLLVFLAHWCPHCNDEIPELLTLRDAGDLPSDLNVVGISTAVVEDRDNFPPSQWVQDRGWEWPVLADTESAEAFQTYGGSGFPFSVILDGNGDVVARTSGSRPAAAIKAWIDASLPTA